MPDLVLPDEWRNKTSQELDKLMEEEKERMGLQEEVIVDDCPETPIDKEDITEESRFCLKNCFAVGVHAS